MSEPHAVYCEGIAGRCSDGMPWFTLFLECIVASTTTEIVMCLRAYLSRILFLSCLHMNLERYMHSFAARGVFHVSGFVHWATGKSWRPGHLISQATFRNSALSAWLKTQLIPARSTSEDTSVTS